MQGHLEAAASVQGMRSPQIPAMKIDNWVNIGNPRSILVFRDKMIL
jgi:hypothetical protein